MCLLRQRLSLLLLLVACFASSAQMLANTWYVRADGGTRYSVNQPNGQCSGLADAAYPGTGVNQPCAFNDYRFLWDDQSYGNLGWVIAGGDTVLLDNTKQWRVGFDGDGSSTDPWCYGGNGPYSCFNPTIPSGTAAQHTKILGRNYASCHAGSAPDPTKMTQIFGGHGIYTALNLKGAQYVDVQCIEVTRHSQCITHGSPAYPTNCSASTPLDDYDSDGIQTDVNTHDLLLQDMWIHGHTDRGIIGPIGGVVTANRVDIGYNGMAGWDFDDGSGTASVHATLNLSYSTIEWNGCNQEYPIVDTYPALSCYGQSNGGYGDGIGTPAGMGMNVSIDHSVFRYNTQDGEDFGHIDTGSSTLSITDSLSYGNNGGQFKWGPAFTSVLFENNLVVGNCLRMSQPLAGAPSTYNANLGDFCRAEDALSFNFVQGGTALFANNTIVTYAPTTFDMQCVSSSCSSTVFTLTNNIVRGYDNSATYNLGGQSGGPGGYCGAGCNNSSQPIGTINRSNNSYYGMHHCPAGTAVGSSGGSVSGETCNDALFTGEPASFIAETTLDNFNFALSSGSPAIADGVAVSGLTTDYDGVARPNPPSLGALQYVGTSILPVTPTLSFSLIASQTFGGAPFPVSATSASSGAVSYAVTSGPASIAGNVVTLSGAGTVVLSASQQATASYAAASATISFTVAQASPTLSFAVIANQTYGVPPFAINAASASNGVVSYTVVSGPATIAGNLVTLTGIGTVVLNAAQQATTNYTAASSTASFLVVSLVPSLSFTPIANQTFGAPPLLVNATSPSTGAITYAVSSGPASLNSTLLTITAPGTVTLKATQAASGDYAAATATTSFTVAPENPNLSFGLIATQTFGNSPFTVVATSDSVGLSTYAVTSGPAALSGNTLTLSGGGIVTLTVSQAAAGNYAAAVATTSFTVLPAMASLTFAAIPDQTDGAASFEVSASSASNGAVSYAVVSGPASVLGNTVTVSGIGTVVLSAAQQATPNYSAATASITFKVTGAIFTISAVGTTGNAPATQTVAPGSNAVFSLMLTPGAVSKFPDAVTLTAGGLPAGATAVFSPSEIQPGSPATAVSLTIQTSSQVAQDERIWPREPLSPLTLGWLLPLLGSKKVRRRLATRSRALTMLAVAVAALVAGLSLGACGGGGSGKTSLPAAMSYTLAITATDVATGSKSTTDLTLIVR